METESDSNQAQRDRRLSLAALIEALAAAPPSSVSPKQLEAMLREASKRLADPSRRISKKELLSFYLAQKSAGTELWREWRAGLLAKGAIDEALVKLLRAKPRRTASGVATVTVLTKPWPCGGDCICCPNDVRMPKSYLSDEPACQRAERCWFDPYLQMTVRLRVLADMGHNIDKVEMIVLGGTFSDYAPGYRIWFIEQLFEALNDFGSSESDAKFDERCSLYKGLGLPSSADALRDEARGVQARVDAGELTYNEAVSAANATGPRRELAGMQICQMPRLQEQHRRNERAAHRSVGLCVETRPELVTPQHLTHLRELGCTKLQIGVQSLSPEVLASMGRAAGVEAVARAMSLMRLFGFKSHVHIMANLPHATPASDKMGYRTLVGDPRFMPDEVKLYPCALVGSSRLMQLYESGQWRPYEEAELLDVLAADLEATPGHTRVSRMIRDISSKDIVAGNKKTNLRQLVERLADERGRAGEGAGISEMRFREISTAGAPLSGLMVDEHAYSTADTEELFIQWIDGEGRLAAFCRLSLPHADAVRALHSEMGSAAADDAKQAAGTVSAVGEEGDAGALCGEAAQRAGECPICEGEAMIREVHVYGRVSKLHESKEGTQHLGLGRAMVERACEVAAIKGYRSIAVISAVGTRDYYRRLGFNDDGLYLRRLLA